MNPQQNRRARVSSNTILIRLLFLLLTSSATLLICLAQEEVWGLGIAQAPAIAPAQESATENPTPLQNSALLPESWARKSAITSTMPIYPEEAIRLGISGVVYIRFETSPEGEVVRIKVKPTTQPLLSKAVVDAVKDWRFSPWRGPDGLAEPVFSRLAFNFVIITGIPNVGMYSPSPHQRATECLECSNSNKEMTQWRDWDEAWSNSHVRENDSPSAKSN